ncbi:MAG: flagellar FliL protein [Candidatus Tokpelaia sp. JSC189]|nr:MAG: flagellar FliL protein [Candidatus Tokpelaia sp. JSC189]
MASHPSQKNSKGEKKTSDIRALMAAVAVLTFVVGFGDWLLGTRIGEAIVLPLQEKLPDKSDKVAADIIANHSTVVVLPPLLTNLASPETTWIRIATSLVTKPKEKITVDMAAEISNDFLAYLRQCSLTYIKGSAGLLYLREDLLDRANIRSGGKVSRILISNLVIEK